MIPYYLLFLPSLYSILSFTSLLLLNCISIPQCSTPSLIVLLVSWVLVISQDRSQKRSPETDTTLVHWSGTKLRSPTCQAKILPWNHPEFLGAPEIEIKRVHHKNSTQGKKTGVLRETTFKGKREMLLPEQKPGNSFKEVGAGRMMSNRDV